MLSESTKKVINNIPNLNEYISNHYFGVDGINSPIDKNLIPTASKSGIVFSEAVARNLFNIAEITQNTDCEYSFILLGNVILKKDGTRGNGAYIEAFFSHNSNINSRSAGFDAENIKLVDMVSKKSTKYDVMFVCHTHPAKGKYYMNFSLGDLDGIVRLYEDNPQFLIKDFGEGILTGDRQPLFAFYDSAGEMVYKFEKYLVKSANNLYTFDGFMNRMVNEKYQDEHHTTSSFHHHK